MNLASVVKKFYMLLGILECHEIRTTISKEQFIELLRPHVGKDGASSMDIFSSDSTDYKGEVGHSGFYLRRKRGLFTNTRHFCKAIGSFREEQEGLIIEIEFRNFPPPVYFYLGLGLVFGLFALIVFLMSVLSFNYDAIVTSFINIINVLVFFGLFGIVVRIVSSKTILKMKYELENNLQRCVGNKA